jgi:hypothetical protein
MLDLIQCNSYFSQLIQDEGLVDVEPIKLLPTWRNGRGDQDYIAKRLDRFLINEELALSGLRYRSWVSNIKISDHMPVILHLEQEKEKFVILLNSIMFGWRNQILLTLVRSWNGFGDRDFKSYGLTC